MLTLAGETNAAARAKAILDFETEIAKVSLDPRDSRDATKTYNKMTVAAAAEARAGLRLGDLSHGRGRRHATSCWSPSRARSPASPRCPQGAAGGAQGPAAGPLARRLCRRPAEGGRRRESSPSTAPSSTARRKTSRGGSARSTSPPASSTDECQQDLRRANISRPNPRRRWTSWSRNIVAAMGRRIDNLTWMAPETKVKAQAKLAAFTTKIGYPDQWHDYSALDDQPRRSVRQCAAREPMRRMTINIGKLGKPDLPLGVGHDPDDGQRLCQFQHGRRSSSRPRSCSRRSSIPMPIRRSTMAASAR